MNNHEHSGYICPLCDNTVEKCELWTTVIANHFRYIAHQQCVETEQEEE